VNTPLRIGNIIRGKTLPALVLGLLAMAALLVVTPLLLGLAVVGWLLWLILRLLGPQGQSFTQGRPAPGRGRTVIEGEYEILRERG